MEIKDFKFEVDPDELKKCNEEIDSKFNNQGYLFLNEIYEYLGFEKIYSNKSLWIKTIKGETIFIQNPESITFGESK